MDDEIRSMELMDCYCFECLWKYEGNYEFGTIFESGCEDVEKYCGFECGWVLEWALLVSD